MSLLFCLSFSSVDKWENILLVSNYRTYVIRVLCCVMCGPYIFSLIKMEPRRYFVSFDEWIKKGQKKKPELFEIN